MAVRFAVKLNGDNNIQRCTQEEMTALVRETIRQYGLAPSVVLTVGSGNLGNLSDTRLKAGAAGSDSTNFDTASELADVSTVTVNYNKVIQTVNSINTLESGDDDWSFPLYLDGDNNLRAMTLTDVYDTFVAPAVLLMCTGDTGTDQAGTYTITSSTSAASGETLVSSTAVFTDTRANAGAYTAGGLPETVDQPTTITNYYLHSIDPAAEATIVRPLVHVRANTDRIQMYPLTDLRAFLRHAIQRAASTTDHTGSTIRYSWSSSGTTNSRGTAMLDTRLDGSTRLTNQVGDDYRAQEVPSGSAGTISTHRLYIVRS
jgi:hypothetical protein